MDLIGYTDSEIILLKLLPYVPRGSAIIMDLIYNMGSEITLLKSLPNLHRCNELIIENFMHLHSDFRRMFYVVIDYELYN